VFRSIQGKSARRASRRLLTKGAKTVLRSTAKIARTAIRESGKAAHRAAKVADRAGKAAQQAVRAAEARAEPARRPPGRFVEADGVRVHYIARGKGRPVVLIHGNGTMAEDFAICGLMDRLSQRYRVIAIDRPGFGHTERPRHQIWTAAAQARLLHRVLERLNVEPPVVVGHSWGTLVALALAAGCRRDIRGLVLLSGYYFPTPRADVALSAPLAIPGVGDAARSLVPEAVGRHVVAPQAFRHVFAPQFVPARFKTRFPVEIAMGPDQLRASAEDTVTLNAAAALLQPFYAGLRTPLAILTGGADAVVDAATHSRRLHAATPDSTLAILPGLGHMIHYFARPQIGRAVDALMNRSCNRVRS